MASSVIEYVTAENPLVSVLITTYNRSSMLADAIESVFNQTYDNFELIVVNDHGEDISAILEKYLGRNVRTVTHLKNMGVSAARNTGILMAGGEIICYLDDDDLFLDNHLMTIVESLQKRPDIEVAYTDAVYISELIQSGFRKIVDKDNRYSGNAYSFERLMAGNYIPINALAHRSNVIDRPDFFDEALSHYEDWDMLLRISQRRRFIHINETTVEVHDRVQLSDSLLSSLDIQHFSEYKKMYSRYPSVQNSEIEYLRLKMLLWINKRNIQLADRMQDIVYHYFMRAVLKLEKIIFVLINSVRKSIKDS